jgi:hypothetical protein
MQQTVECALDQRGSDRYEIEQRTRRCRDGNWADVSRLDALKSARPPDRDTGEGWGVALGDEHLDDGPLELPALPEIGRAPMRRNATRRQARGQDVTLERTLGAPDGVDAGVNYQDGAVRHGAIELARREAPVQPLAPGEEAVLSGRQSHDRVDGGRVGPEPERITHRYGW